MGTRLRDMIRSIRACKTAAEERGVVAKECAILRNAFKESDPDYRHRNVAKLMFIHMLGYPTHFGQMECIKSIAAPSFPEKRIGYLGLMLLLDERQEVLMLVTNSMKNDLGHTNQFIVGLALCALGNICTAEMARDLAPEVEKLLHSTNSYVRKKAALCSVRIVRKVPDLVENLMVPATGLLTDKHHGVLVAGVKLCTELCQTSEVAIEHFRKHVNTMVRVLKNLVISGYAPEYDVSGITDPFLQIRLLRLLRLLGNGDADISDTMSDVLAQVATNIEGNKNAGNAILYECVQTIMAIEAIAGLRVLAINILGRFLANRDNNIRYVALNTLVKVVSIDTQAVQRHRTTVVECVKDSDISIRRRALELVCALVNETNVKVLTKELVDYLKVTDPDFKGDLTARIAGLVQKFAPNKQWYIDQIILLMVEAGKYVTSDVTRSLVVVISNANALQGYTVRTLYRVFQAWDGQESFAQVALWCIGEYGDLLVSSENKLEGEEPLTVTESDIVEIVENALKDSRASSATVAFALTALLKLSIRLPNSADRIKALILEHKGSLVLELQQRAIEFGSILTKHNDLKGALVERMPVLDEARYYANNAMGIDGQQTTDIEALEPHANGHVRQPNAIEKPTAAAAAAAANLIDLLSFTDEPTTLSNSSGNALLDLLGGGPMGDANSASSPGGGDMFLDLLSSDGPAPLATTAAVPLEGLLDVEPIANTSLGNSSLNGGTPKGPPAIVDPIANISFGNLSLNGGTAKGPPAVVDPFADLTSTAMPAPASAPGLPSIIAMQTNGLKISFDFTKAVDAPKATVIKASYSNLSSNIYTDFVLQAAVPKLEPATSGILSANSSNLVTQVIKLTNNMHGQKALVMKLRVSYKVNGNNVLEQGQVNNFPAGL
ncbi:AP-1 complex subunit gamma-2 isoform X2 [Physcomitrium patens]|uniref:AP-1 complex subunit gamma-2 isoform X2 n=1 Tax=Physcomitrium patens TaxID=3218 RepID=UPI000D179232|nr:AP-1 complex subunit gamma-2-like isoform X2 [Physcomitrium patens]|eukprot:XP_024366847.1 AP-1 complex subunit gamma-2-like isoform X2 [Physcomitrella patens]